MHGAARVVLAVIIAALALSTPARAQTTITVNSLNDPSDSGNCTLRDAINVAQGGIISPDVCSTGGSGSPYTIVFSVTGTIMLSSSLPAIANTSPGSLTITGPTTSPGITIDGGGSYEVMSVNFGATLNVANLIISNGFGEEGGGGIKNFGTLTVTNSTFSANGTASGHLAAASINAGTLTVTNSTFSGNSASNGGGISNDGGTLTVTNSTFSGNSAVNSGGGIYNDRHADGHQQHLLRQRRQRRRRHLQRRHANGHQQHFLRQQREPRRRHLQRRGIRHA